MRDINLGAARRAARMRPSETLFILSWFVTRTLGEYILIQKESGTDWLPGDRRRVFAKCALVC